MACDAVFAFGPKSLEAEKSCGEGWHICKSAFECETKGLTKDACESQRTVSPPVFWATLESSYSHGNCVNDDDDGGQGLNDIWGCGILHNNSCGVLTGSFGNNFHRDDTPHVCKVAWSSANTKKELQTTTKLNGCGGVLCCMND